MMWKLAILISFMGLSAVTYGQQQRLEPAALYKFEGNTANSGRVADGTKPEKNRILLAEGLEGQGLNFNSVNKSAPSSINIQGFQLGSENDFTVQFWVKSVMDANQQTVLLSQKEFNSTSLASQKNPGWVFYTSGGTWAWNMGAGDRRITYERSNGEHLPLNDGKWHQLTMTYSKDLAEVRLYYDGANKAIYNVSDDGEFDFTAGNILQLGTGKNSKNFYTKELALLRQGADTLQALVNEFDRLCLKYGASKVTPKEFENLVVGPEELMKRKIASDDGERSPSVDKVDFSRIKKLESRLMDNPYTVHQVKDFMEVAPLLQIYSLSDGKVVVDETMAQAKARKVTLDKPNITLDNLAIWESVLSAEDIRESYKKYAKLEVPDTKQKVISLTSGVWNIHHGGIHATKEKDGWDSRRRIIEILKNENVDVVMMQETYSNGDYIAAELGYYYATTIDWDYLNQGSNISVLSRYPIKEIHVPDAAAFMNVGAKIAISETQDIYVMSNWYGMNQFSTVFDFHQSRFQCSDDIPVLFGGDFNAVPHTDGGNSPASKKLLENDFTDAFRSTYPDVEQHPGYTHISDQRIDQLYYKGNSLKNTSTSHISTWPSGFPSDHALIKSTFKLD